MCKMIIYIKYDWPVGGQISHWTIKFVEIIKRKL